MEVEIQTLNFPRDLLRKFLKYPTIFLKLYQFWLKLKADKKTGYKTEIDDLPRTLLTSVSCKAVTK